MGSLQYLISLRSHRRLTAFSCGPMANHNLFVRLAVAMGCGTLWLVGLTARMTLHICFNRCYVVMQACVQFPEWGGKRASQAAFISEFCQSDRRTAAARKN